MAIISDNKIKLSGEWFALETNEGGSFRWMGKSGTILLGNHAFDSIKIKFASGPKGLEDRQLNINLGEGLETNITLVSGQLGEFLVPIKNTSTVNLSISTFNPGIDDPRKLGICVYGFYLIAPGSEPEYIDIEDVEIEVGVKLETVERKIIDTVIGTKNIDVVSIVRSSRIPFKGVYYIGQYGTCGYASAAKGYLCNFYFNGIPTTWEPLYFDDSKLSDDSYFNLIAKSLINKKIKDYDTVIIHCTPDLWPLLLSQRKDIIKNKRVVGYAVWETSKLPESWVEKMNRSVHEIWCPSNYNKEVFQNSGINLPITVVPHVFLESKLPPKPSVRLYSYSKQELINDEKSPRLTFYNISEMNHRKGVEDLIKTFCETFTSYDQVRLLLKVHYRSYSLENKMSCVARINDISNQYPSPPKIDYIVNNMTDGQLINLHALGDCYVSLCKSEGFGLPIYEAYRHGKRVIATGYSGHVDFLGQDHPGLVRYTLEKVSGMEEFSKMYTDDAEWAIPDLDHAGELMRKEYDLWAKAINLKI